MDGSADTGCRFKYITPEIDFTYQALVDAINDAIDKEAKMTDNKFITDERTEVQETEELDFDNLMNQFNQLVASIPQDKLSYYAPRITEITNKYLGKGKKVSNASREQVEQLSLIIMDLEEMLNKEG